MNKKLGILGLLAASVTSLFMPAVASAQERCVTYRGYRGPVVYVAPAPVPVYYHDRYWRDRYWHDRYWREHRGYGPYRYR